MSDSIRFACITDIHGQMRWYDRILDQLPDVDAILLGGDLSVRANLTQVKSIVEDARRICSNTFAVAGNCDSLEIDEALVDWNVSLHGRAAQLDFLSLIGLSSMPPWNGKMYELTEEEIEAFLERGYGDCRRVMNGIQSSDEPIEDQPIVPIVLSHPPPYQCDVDCVDQNKHVGSRSLRSFIDRRSPLAVICGHIHEARGVCLIDNTVVVNCGRAFLGEYAVVCVEKGNSTNEPGQANQDESLVQLSHYHPNLDAHVSVSLRQAIC